MIPFDFEYYKPDTVEEAAQIFKELDAQGKEPLYYGGGTEIITLARLNNIYTKAVIDLKGIPECNSIDFHEDNLVIGAAVTLTKISESKVFPLLGKAGGRIADHTTQGKITIGGNVAGTIIYRETVLPLLLCDSRVVVFRDNVLLELPLYEVFNERLKLPKGEFIIRFVIGKEFTAMPFVHVKKAKSEKIDYPLVSVAAIRKDDRIRVAISGVCGFPFRSAQVEEDLNDRNSSRETRAANALSHLPAAVMSNMYGSDGYRKFVLKNSLVNTLESLEEI